MSELENYQSENELNSDLLTFKLGNNHLPGKDRLSKLILKSSSVVDLIASDLLDVPNGTYMTASAEWQDGLSGDVLYVPQLGIQSSLPPILIEIQLVVDTKFMQEIVKYCQRIYEIYKTYPMVLIFCIKKVSPSTLINRFKPIASKTWMHSIICCDFWAKSCYIVSKNTLPSDEYGTNISPFLALSMFLLEQSETLYGHSHANNSTIIMLYRIAKDKVYQDVEKEEELSDIVDVICSNNEKLLKKVENLLENVPDAGKAKQIVSRALEFNLLAKRKYITSNISESSLEALPKFRLKKEQQGYGKSNDDLDFIVKYRKKM